MPLFVQKGNSGTPSGTSTTKSVVLNGQVAGNMNVVTVAYGSSTPQPPTTSVVSVRDDLSNVYLQATLPAAFSNNSPNVGLICSYYLPNIPAGNRTVTVTMSGPTIFFVVSVSEYHAPANATYINSGAASYSYPTPNNNTSGGRVYATPNDLVITIFSANAGMTSIAAPFTQRDQVYQILTADMDQPASSGIVAPTGVCGDSGGWAGQVLRFALTAQPTPPPTGEVLLSDAFSADVGDPTQLQDANTLGLPGYGWSAWTPGPGVHWVRINAGSPCRLSRIRMSVAIGGEDLPIGCTLWAGNDPGFILNKVTLLTVPNTRQISGTLMTEFIVNSPNPYQYYLWNTKDYSSGVWDLDLYVVNAGIGAITRPSDIALSPTTGQYDLPTVLTLSTLTSSATIYYTTDGSTPTTASPVYSGPFVQSNSCTLKAMAVAPGCFSNGRVLSRPVHIGQTEVSTDVVYDSRNYRLWAVNGSIFQDPISRYWYRYGVNFDCNAIYQGGHPGVSVYRSADLRNWDWRPPMMQLGPGLQDGYDNSVWHILPRVLYNAVNRNYVLWADSYTEPAGNAEGKTCWTSTSPEGPFTLFATYTTIGPITGNLGSGGAKVQGDFALFTDADGVTSYLVSTMATNVVNDTMVIAKLDANYTNFGPVTTYPWSSIPAIGANAAEAPFIFYRNGTYFMLCSHQTGWTTNQNFYLTSSVVTGPYSNYTIPFLPVSGGVPDYTTSYNSQSWFIYTIPGRNGGDIWHSDRYDYQVNNTMMPWVRIRLPVIFSGNSFTIPWNPAYSFDSAMPTVSGAPIKPSNILVSPDGTAASWINNEFYPHKLYFDQASNSAFTQGVRSIVLPDGATTVTGLSASPTGTYNRVRAVNASGFSVSKSVASGAIAGGNPPFMPPSFASGPPTKVVWEDGPGRYVIPPNIGSPIYYNGQSQTATIQIANPLPPSQTLPGAADKNLSKIK